MSNLGQVVATVQKNCHISDAQYAGDYTLCVFLLKMREFYRWEHGSAFADQPPRAEIGAWIAERLGWTAARRAIGTFIDFLFWPPQFYEALGRRAFGDATLQRQIYRLEWNAWFTPVIGMPWLEWPHFAYPFDVCLFRWQLKNAA